MKKILVPTDFSPAAENAYQYAFALAKKLHCGVHLVHVYRPPVEAAFPVLLPPVEDPDEMREWFFGKLQDRLDPLAPDHEGVPVTCEVPMGFPVDGIRFAAEPDDVALIVMGTQGEHSLAEKLFGSVTIDVLRRSPKPVIAVPDGCTFTDIDKILYATDLGSAEEKVVEEIIEFAAKFAAEIHFVNVNHNINDAENVIEKLIDSITAETTHAVAFELATIEHESLHVAVNDYAAHHGIDLIAMSTHHHNFFERIFLSSGTREIALHTHLPLLVLHY